MSEPQGLHYEKYQANGSDEWLMRIGPAEAPAILFLPALFEEMNRTRALTAGVMRRLAASGYGCWLIDLPGTGESEQPIDRCDWDDWRNAAAAGVAHASQRASLQMVASIRGGCLLDDAVQAPRVWRFAPVDGASLVRDLTRAGLMGGGGSAGYAPSDSLLSMIERAKPSPEGDVRTVRLASDRNAADSKVEGSALWRRSEPATSASLADRLAADIVQWVGSCAAS